MYFISKYIAFSISYLAEKFAINGVFKEWWKIPLRRGCESLIFHHNLQLHLTLNGVFIPPLSSD